MPDLIDRYGDKPKPYYPNWELILYVCGVILFGLFIAISIVLR